MSIPEYHIPEYYKRYEITTVTSDSGRWDVRCSQCKLNLHAPYHTIAAVLGAIEPHEFAYHPKAREDTDFETAWPTYEVMSAPNAPFFEGGRPVAFTPIPDPQVGVETTPADPIPVDYVPPRDFLPYIQISPGGVVVNTRNQWLLIEVQS